MNRAIVYLRVSSKDGRQDEDAQLPGCLQLCEARDWIPEIVRERQSAGAGKVRPLWLATLERIRRGEVRALVVWSVDRLGRDRVQLAHDLARISSWGATVASVCDPWLDQPAGPMRDLLVQVMGWVAQSWRDHMIRQTRAGLARAAKKGHRPGRPPVDAGRVARALELVQGGRSVAAAAREAGIGRRTLRARLAPGVKGSGDLGGGNCR